MTKNDLLDSLKAWTKADIISSDQADRIIALETALHDRPTPLATHTSLQLLFAEIRTFVKEHPGATVISADDPSARLIGWAAFVIEGGVEHTMHCSIGFSSLNRQTLPPGFRSEFGASEGRRAIAGRLTRGETLSPEL